MHGVWGFGRSTGASNDHPGRSGRAGLRFIVAGVLIVSGVSAPPALAGPWSQLPDAIDQLTDRPGDEDVFEKVDGDFKAKNVEMSEHRIRRQMEDLLIEARDQIASE